MRLLDLADNELTGPIPAEFGNLAESGQSCTSTTTP